MHEKTRRGLDELRKRIASDGFTDAGFFPSERNLCSMLGVGRGAVRRILDELVSEGSAVYVAGKGICLNNTFRRFLTVVPSGATRGAEAMAILNGIAIAAAERDAEMILFFHSSGGGTDRLAGRIAHGGFDGVIFLEEFSRKALLQVQKADLPAVVANMEENSTLPAVKTDYRRVGRLAAEYLFERGHRRIGFLSGAAGRFIYREMLSGIRNAAAERKLKLRPEDILFLDFNTPLEEQRRMLEQLLGRSDRPTALIAGRDSRARILYECCAGLGIRIPDALSVIGYDNLSWAEAERNGLTTIAQPAVETGRRALEMLFDARVRGLELRTRLLAPRLIERLSVRSL